MSRVEESNDAVTRNFNMGLQLVTVGIALPVKVYQKLLLLGPKVLGPLSHQDLQNLCQPFLHLCALKIFAEGMEVVPLTLDLSRGVDLVGHDASDGLLNILHPLSHLLVAHVIDILDEGIVLLPEGHPEAATLRGWVDESSA